ncbi:molybdopterin biosynthesis protein MoeA [Geminocystis sp. NIES-3708]|uniref:molybdopterin molybdotransferase MoeA n=1 Tax=Geminocystis sp. NIES-3708 TaxID=1615909 RepID=UPI0005FCA2FD|nr:gephyrin-like molybdotransferase Glp [Geminocystis sp. NIES-3708]BAQ62159.1 molybdopterin biosynthesis protein MoeA [Geminocystis sp. NIES-3708]
MLTVNEVEKFILNLVKPITDKELVPLSQATNRILAENISSSFDFPYDDNSAMDGYAVKYQNVAMASQDSPVSLKIIEEIPAGYCPQKTILDGETSRIFTGAILPQGADSIVIQENTQREGDQIKVFASPLKNEFVRYQGSYYRAGECLLSAGYKINPPEMAILAAAQCLEVPVIRSPIIAILSTGDELIAPEESMEKGKIIDSNQYLLASFIQQNGGIPLSLGIIPDHPLALENAIKEALNQADWVISTGGVSVGDYDYVDQVLEKLGGKIHVKGVKMKPGKPLTVATFCHDKLYFGIPGNPVSTMVTCWRFLQTAIEKLSAKKNYSYPSIVKGITFNNLRSQGTRETYVWGNVSLIKGHYQFTIAKGSHNSGNLVNLQQINGLAIIPINTNLIEIGDDVEIMLVNN